MAVNCWVFATNTDGVAGVTAMDANAGGATVSAVFPLISPIVAITVTLPCAPPIVVTRPALLIVADPVPFVLAQVTELVRSCVELSV